ncbi:MAG: hypothetical protein IJP08_03330 [Bacteroidaceae bacterium]|nr:hypothetical protein [Bacteroidaceae bacterium]
MKKEHEKIQEYIKKNMRQFMVKINRVTEPELLEWLESQPNKQGYIKELILADMEKHRGKQYRYGMRLRGFSIGCQPMDGFVERQDDTTGKYHDILVYDRKLTEKELEEYELDEL